MASAPRRMRSLRRPLRLPGAMRPHRPPSAFDWLTLVVALAAFDRPARRRRAVHRDAGPSRAGARLTDESTTLYWPHVPVFLLRRGRTHDAPEPWTFAVPVMRFSDETNTLSPPAATDRSSSRCLTRRGCGGWCRFSEMRRDAWERRAHRAGASHHGAPVCAREGLPRGPSRA